MSLQISNGLMGRKVREVSDASWKPIQGVITGFLSNGNELMAVVLHYDQQKRVRVAIRDISYLEILDDETL